MCDCSSKQRIQKQQFCVTVGFHYHDWPVLLLCEITLEALICLSQHCHLLTKLNIALAPHQVRVNDLFRSVLCQTTVTTKTKKDDVVWGSTTLKLLLQELWNLFLMLKILRLSTHSVLFTTELDRYINFGLLQSQQKEVRCVHPAEKKRQLSKVSTLL